MGGVCCAESRKDDEVRELKEETVKEPISAISPRKQIDY
jgi:hypothetical protein